MPAPTWWLCLDVRHDDSGHDYRAHNVGDMCWLSCERRHVIPCMRTACDDVIDLSPRFQGTVPLSPPHHGLARRSVMESVLKYVECGPDEDLLAALRDFNEQVRWSQWWGPGQLRIWCVCAIDLSRLPFAPVPLQNTTNFQLGASAEERQVRRMLAWPRPLWWAWSAPCPASKPSRVFCGAPGAGPLW